MNIMDWILLFHIATLCYIIASTTSLNHKPTSFCRWCMWWSLFPLSSFSC
jgi:hypothetical protein